MAPSEDGSPTWCELLAARASAVQLARALVRDVQVAEDLAHDALTAASLRTDLRNPWGWLRGAIHHLASRHHRRAARYAPLVDEPAGDAASPAELLETAQLQARLVEAVLALSEPYRATVLLRYWSNLPPRAIAARQAVPVATVRTRLQRAAQQLRARLDATGGRGAWLGAAAALSQTPIRGLSRLSHPPAAVAATLTIMAILSCGLVSILWLSPDPVAPIAGEPAAPTLAQHATVRRSPPLREAVDPDTPIRAGLPVSPQAPTEPAATPVRLRLLDENGAAVVDADVAVRRPEYELPEGSTDPVAALFAARAGTLPRHPDADVVAIRARSDAQGTVQLTIPWPSARVVATTGGASSGWIFVKQGMAERLVVMRPTTPVRGQVLDAAGKTIGGVVVHFHPVGSASDFRPCSPEPVTTDDAGRFACRIEPGIWVTDVQGPGGTAGRAFERVEIRAGGRAEVVVKLQELGASVLHFELHHPDGDPGQVLVYALRTGVERPQTFAATEREGTRGKLLLPARGRFTVFAKGDGLTAAPVEVEVLDAQPLAPVRLTLVATARIVGTAFDSSGRVLPGTSISCCESLADGGRGRCRAVMTDAEGRFRFDGLEPAMSYQLSFHPDPQSPRVVARIVRPGEDVRLEDDPSPGAPLTVRVIDAATRRAVPNAGVRVMRQRSGAPGIGLGFGIKAYDCDAQGALVLPDVGVSERPVVAVAVAGYATTLCSVAHGTEPFHDVLLERAGSAVVMVRDANGKPALGANVRLTRRAPPEWLLLLGGIVPPALVTANAAAGFVDLAPATYDVRVDGGPGRGEASGSLVVPAGGQVELRLALSPR